jgi:hypothetical protein
VKLHHLGSNRHLQNLFGITALVDYCTEFIWYNLEDIKHCEDRHVESEEVLSPFPSSVLELRDAWIDRWR